MESVLEATVRNTDLKGENNPVRIKCPECSSQRKKKTERTLSVTRKDGKFLYQCWHCGISGGYSTNSNTTPTNTDISITREERNVAVGSPRLAPVITDIQSLSTDNSAFKDFIKQRHISSEVCDKLGILADTKGFNGAGTTDAIGFPYKRDGEIYAVKWRNISEKGFTQEGSANTFFNLDRLNIEGSILICEGELDVLAMEEAGVEVPTVSVPNGAPIKVSNNKVDPSEDRKFSYVWEARDVLEGCDKVILAVDNDSAGLALAEELSRRIGKGKCLTVTYPEDCKDANDVLINHGAEKLVEIVENAKPVPIKGLNGANFYEDRLSTLYNGGEYRGISTGFESLDRLYTLSTGMLTTITGIPSSGKSQFSSQLMLNTAISDDWKWCVCSFENPVEILIASMCEMFVGKSFFESDNKMNEEEKREALKFVDDHFVFIDHMGGASSDVKSIIQLAQTSCMRLGIRGLLIDPFNYVTLPKGETSETNQISKMLTELQLFAKSADIHVIFVAHPHKMYPDSNGQTPIPTGHHISGSASWFSKTDHGISIDRGDGDVTILCWKCRFRWLGEQGMVKLGFDEVCGRYLEQSDFGMYDPMGSSIEGSIDEEEEDDSWIEF